MTGRLGLAILAAVAVAGGAASRSGGAQEAQCPPSAGFKPGSVADHGAASAHGRAIALEAGDSYFEPTCAVNVPSGELELRVKNTGRVLHNVSFESPAIDQDVAPGETVTIKVPMGKEPRLFTCKYHSAAGMKGALLPAAAGTRTRKE